MFLQPRLLIVLATVGLVGTYQVHADEHEGPPPIKWVEEKSISGDFLDYDIAISRDKQYIAAAVSIENLPHLFILDRISEEEIIFPIFGGNLVDITFSRFDNNTVAACNRDGVWVVKILERESQYMPITGCEDLSFSSNSTNLAIYAGPRGQTSSQMIFVDIANFSEVLRTKIPPQIGPIQRSANLIASMDQEAVTSSFGNINIWRQNALGNPVKALDRAINMDTILGFGISPDGKALYTVSNSFVRASSTESSRALWTINHTISDPRIALFSDDASRLLIAGPSEASIFAVAADSSGFSRKLSTFRLPLSTPEHASVLREFQISFSGNDRLIYSYGGGVTVWDADLGGQAIFSSPQAQAGAMSSDNNLLAYFYPPVEGRGLRIITKAP